MTSIEVTEFMLGLPLEQAAELIVGVLTVLDPSRLTGPDALRLYEQFAGVERLGMSGKTLIAPRIDESGVCRDHGHPNTAALLAEAEGVPTGPARNSLEVGIRLFQLPGTEDERALILAEGERRAVSGRASAPALPAVWPAPL